MKILSIVGSPRINANSHTLSQKVLEGAKEKGAQVEEILLRRQKIGPCIDCAKCHEDGICKVKDDFGEVAEKMKASDGLVLSTPVYCFNVTGHLKCLIDRCHSFVYPDFQTGLVGKKVVAVITSGFPMPMDEGAVAMERSNVDPEVFFEMDRKLRLSTGDTFRCLIDPTLTFDPTVDTLRTLYQFCAMTRSELSAFLEVTGLGNDTEAVTHRPEDLQKAVDLGIRLVEMPTMGPPQT